MQGCRMLRWPCFFGAINFVPHIVFDIFAPQCAVVGALPKL